VKIFAKLKSTADAGNWEATQDPTVNSTSL
jgi:hypothetical protein